MADIYLNNTKDLAGYENLTRFDGFYDNRYYDPMVSGYGFIFITKPSLFICPTKTTGSYDEMAYKNMTRDPYFVRFLETEAFNESDKLLPKLLSFRYYNNVGTFIPMFTNKLKNLETNDIVMESSDVFDTKQGYRMPMPTFTSSSESVSQLSLSVTESANMDFTKLMSLWVKYINNVSDGTFDAHPTYVADGVLDYTCSIYYFALDPDGRTLKYWSKYTGCWPTTIPYSAMRYNRGDPQLVDIDIPFIYTYKEDMTPDILEDFNIVSMGMQDNLVNIKNNILNNFQNAGSEDGFNSAKDNIFLTERGINRINASVLKNKDRQPLVLLSERVTDLDTTYKYILSFGESTNDARFIKNILKGDDTTIIDKNGKEQKFSLTDSDVDNYYFSINADDGFFTL